MNSIKKNFFLPVFILINFSFAFSISFTDYKENNVKILSQFYASRISYNELQYFYKNFFKKNPVIAQALREYYTGLNYLDTRQTKRAIPYIKKAQQLFSDNVFFQKHLELLLNSGSINALDVYQSDVIPLIVKGQYIPAWKNFIKYVDSYRSEWGSENLKSYLVYKIQPEDMEELALVSTRLGSQIRVLEKLNKQFNSLSIKTYQFVAFPFLENEFVLPCKGFISSLWGFRLDPFRAQPEIHSGVDIETDADEPIKCAADGVVRSAFYSPGGGNMVFVKHVNGYESRYFHGKKLLVKAGQRVKKGQVIMIAGSLGHGNSIHLHFEVYHNGVNKDPLSLYR